MRHELGPQNSVSIHVTLVPYIAVAGELKTKPTQHSVKALREIGIQPEYLICRSEIKMDEDSVQKIAQFCNIRPDHVIEALDASTIYEVPLMMADQSVDQKLSQDLNIWARSPDLSQWRQIVERVKEPKFTTTIGIVGKYTELTDSYKSLNEALLHAGIAHNSNVQLEFIEADNLTHDTMETIFAPCDALLIPGGFGTRGIEGKIRAAQFAREHNIPLFGICLGLQMMAVEFARNVCGLKEAHTVEFDPETKNPIITYMEDQTSDGAKGGSMRLGSYPCVLQEGSLVRNIYGSETISERHRHRLEFNNDYRDLLSEHGLRICGQSPDKSLVEIIELPEHRWYVGCQFHPEFKSQPTHPHPLFKSFIAAALAARAEHAEHRERNEE